MLRDPTGLRRPMLHETSQILDPLDGAAPSFDVPDRPQTSASSERDPEPYAIKRLLATLEAEGVRYCLLRGGLDDSDERTRDIDLLIDPASMARCLEVLADAGFWRRPRPAPYKLVLIRYADGVVTVLDIHWKAVQSGIVYMDERLMLERRVRHDGVFRLAPEDRLMHLVFHNFMRSGPLRPGALSEILSLLRGPLDRAYIHRHLGPFGLDEAFREACEWLEGRRQKSETRRIRRRLFRSVLQANRGNRVRYACTRMARRWPRRRRGGLVAVVGPDGSGKSTVVKSVCDRSRTIPSLKVDTAYLGPWGQMQTRLVPALRRLGIRPTVEPWGLAAGFAGLLNPFRWALCMLRGTLFYLATYWELRRRYTRIVRPQVRRGGWIVADRYITDLRHLYKSEPIRNYRVLRALVCRLFPDPDLYVMLDNRPDVIAERKAQLSPLEIETMQELCLEAIQSNPHEIIATDRPPTAVADEILNLILALESTR